MPATAPCRQYSTESSCLKMHVEGTHRISRVRGGCMRRVLIGLLAFVIAALAGVGLVARDEQGGGGQGQQAQARGGRLPAIAERMDGLRRFDGFFPLYWDEGTGALYLEIPKLDTEILWVTGVG